MKKYFCFFEENILNVQKSNVSIYNVLDGRVYYYDGLEAEFVKILSNTSDIEFSIKKSKISEKLAEDLLASLYKLELGSYSDHFIASLDLIEPPYWRDLIIDIDYLNLICELLPHNMNKKIIFGYNSKYANNMDDISNKFNEVYINISEKEFFIEKTGVFLDSLKNKEKYNIIIITEDVNFFKENKITIEKNKKFKSISASRIINKNDLEDIISKEDLYVPATSINQYMYKNIYNTCLNGLITLSGNGDLSVCPLMPELKVGSVYNFDVALKYSNINKYWRLNKTNIDLCKECSLNSTCYDCRFIAYYLFGDIKSMYTCNKVNQLKATIRED